MGFIDLLLGQSGAQKVRDTSFLGTGTQQF